MTATLTPLAATSTVSPADIRAWIDATKIDVIGRDAELDAIAAAVLSRTHIFFLGKPGCGKSWMTKRMLDRVSDLVAFYTAFNKFTTDVDVFGQKSMLAMKQDITRRVTTGRLPEAYVARLDEIFKAGESALNTMLPILNERIYEAENGRWVDVPLACAIAMSNEMPQQESEELAALWDRLPTRRIVDRVTDPDDLKRIILLDPVKHPAPVITWAQIEDAQSQVAAVQLGDDTVDALVKIIRKLGELGIHPSERRTRECMALVRCAAWMDGQTVAAPRHLAPLVHVFWEREEQVRDVEKTVLEVCSPHLKEIIGLSDDVAELHEQLDNLLATADGTARRDAAVELYKKATAAGEKLLDLESTAGPVVTQVADTWRRLEDIHLRVMRETYSVTNPLPLRDQILRERS